MLGLSGRAPARVDAVTKAALHRLLDDATAAGWSLRGACRELDLGEVRAYRWMERRTAGELEDYAPGGNPMHGLLEDEVVTIMDLYNPAGRSTARTASSPIGGPTPTPCGSPRPRCGASWQLTACGSTFRRARALRCASPSLWVEYRP
jgi:hypothetical protein